MIDRACAFRLWRRQSPSRDCSQGTPASAGTLDVAPEATWSGDFGLALALTDADPAYVETDTPDDETRYVVRFYFNADAVTLGPGGSLVLFRGLSGALAPVVTVLLKSDGGSGRELVYTVKTDTAEASSADVPVASGWHLLELDWAAAAGPGTNDGFLVTRLDGVPTAAWPCWTMTSRRSASRAGVRWWWPPLPVERCGSTTSRRGGRARSDRSWPGRSTSMATERSRPSPTAYSSCAPRSVSPAPL